MDETILSLHPPLRACWMKRGQQKRIPTPGVQQRMHLFGAYRWKKDTLVWIGTQRKNNQAFIEFQENLFIERYPTGHFILVLDNASIHKSAASLTVLSLFEHRVRVIWLPAYCSELNPIERFWRYLKELVCINKLYPSMANLVQAVTEQLLCQNDCQRSDRFSLYAMTYLSNV
jgi:transposase